MNNLLNFAGKYITRAMVLKVGTAILTKRAGLIGLGAGTIAAVGYMAYQSMYGRKKADITHIDDISDNDHDVPGDKQIVI